MVAVFAELWGAGRPQCSARLFCRDPSHLLGAGPSRGAASVAPGAHPCVLLVYAEGAPAGGSRAVWTCPAAGDGGPAGAAGRAVARVARVWCAQSPSHACVVVYNVLARAGAGAVRRLCFYADADFRRRSAPRRPVRPYGRRPLRVENVCGRVALGPAQLRRLVRALDAVAVRAGRSRQRLEIPTVCGSLQVCDAGQGGVSFGGARDPRDLVRLLSGVVACEGGVPADAVRVHAFVASACLGRRFVVGAGTPVPGALARRFPPWAVRYRHCTEDEASVCRFDILDAQTFLGRLLPRAWLGADTLACARGATLSVSLSALGVLIVRICWRHAVPCALLGDGMRAARRLCGAVRRGVQCVG
jgi:hypothetical protein